MRVHAIQMGRLRGNKTTTRAASRWSLLQKWEDVECPWSARNWFLEDWAADHGVFGALFYPERAVETTDRIRPFVQDVPTILLPAHDADAPRRLAARETVRPPQEEATRAWRRSA